MIAYQLTRSVAFSWIAGAGLSRLRYGLPLAITIVCSLLSWLLCYIGFAVPLRKIAEATAAALVTLPGFYIAALAAVSAFQSPSLDQIIEGEGARVKVVSRGVFEIIDLTYRMYVCYLFAYLTALSVLLYLMLSLSDEVSDALTRLVPSRWADGLNVAGSIFLLFWTVNLVLVTLHGLYFLAERMHRPSA